MQIRDDQANHSCQASQLLVEAHVRLKSIMHSTFVSGSLERLNRREGKRIVRVSHFFQARDGKLSPAVDRCHVRSIDSAMEKRYLSSAYFQAREKDKSDSIRGASVCLNSGTLRPSHFIAMAAVRRAEVSSFGLSLINFPSLSSISIRQPVILLSEPVHCMSEHRLPFHFHEFFDHVAK